MADKLGASSQDRSEELRNTNLTSLYRLESGAEVARIVKFLSVPTTVPTFGVAICNIRVLRDFFISEVKGRIAGITEVSLTSSDDILLSILQKCDASDTRAVFLIDLEKRLRWNSGVSRLLRQLETARERWTKEVTYPVMFWVPEYVANLLANQAPHFWRLKATEFELAGDVPRHAVEFDDPFSSGIEFVLRASVGAKFARLAQLENTIRDEKGTTKNIANAQLAPWLYEFGTLLRSIGDYDGAEKVFRELINAANQLGNDARKAAAFSGLGLVYQGRGDKLQALEYHRKAASLYKRLERIEHCVASLGNAGLIYLWYNEPRNAEAFFDQVLNDCDTKKANLNVAYTYANLAAISYARGDRIQGNRNTREALEVVHSLKAEDQTEFKSVARFRKSLEVRLARDFRRPVDIQETGRLLTAFRKRSGVSLAEIEERLIAQIEEQENWPAGNKLMRLVGDDTQNKLVELERGDIDIELHLGDVRLLAKIYDIPPLMFDPLFSETVRDRDWLVLGLDDGVVPMGDPDDAFYGSDAKYSIPGRRLAETDVAFVLLELELGGHSDVHTHPGNELLLVIEGTIEFRFSHNGVRTSLNKGDYIHFYAEQPHSAWNVSGELAKAFIIRFYQFETRDILQKTRMKRRDAGDFPYINREDLLKYEFRIFEKWSRHLTADDRDKTIPIVMNLCDALDNEDSVSSQQCVKSLAEIYRIEPRLFFHFLFSALHDVVVVRKDDSQDHLVPIDPELFRNKDVFYQVPQRFLAYSDVAIGFVTLKSGGETNKHGHPGTELLLMIRGKIEVHIGHRSKFEVLSDPPQFAHFRSYEPHFVRNGGEIPAEYMVIRFHADHPVGLD